VRWKGYAVKRLESKFVLSIVLVTAALGAAILWLAYRGSHDQVNRLTAVQTRMALEFDLAIRDYVTDVIRPRELARLGPDEFIPETMSSSYVARNIFAGVRRTFPDYVIKFSSDNPRNPDNLASPEELKVLQYFREHPEVTIWEGRVKVGGREYYGVYRPRRLKEECLQCHGDPADAPASLLARYGDTGGFHRQAGQVVAMDAVALPLDTARERVARTASWLLVVIGVGLLLEVVLASYMFRRIAGRRIAAMAGHFRALAETPEDAAVRPLPVTGHDEIDDMASSFNALADRLRDWHADMQRRVRERTAELEALQAQYRGLVDNIPVGLYRNSPGPEGRFIMGNPAIARMFGYDSVEEFLQVPVASLYADSARRMVFSRRLLAHGRLAGEALALRRKDGTTFHGEVTAQVVRDADDHVVHFDGTILDVTARKQAEDELRAARDRARKYLDVAGVMLLALDADGRITLLNRKGCALIGCTEEQALGVDWFDTFLPPRVREATRNVFNRLMAGETEGVAYVEQAVRTLEGEERLMAWHNTVMTVADGRIVGTLSSGEDVTERRRAEEALRRSEERFRDLAELLPETVWESDLAGRLTFSNKNALNLFGYSPEDIERGLSIWDVMDPADHGAIRANLGRLLKEGASDVNEYRAQRRDGTTFPCTVHAAPVRQGEAVVGFRGILVDITQRKRIEEATERETAKLSAMISGMDEGVVFANADGVVVEVNDWFCRFVGRPRDQVLGLQLEDIHHGPVRERVLAQIEQFRADPTAKPLTLQRPLGEAEVVMRVQPISRDGRYEGVLLNVIDVTALVRAREALEEANRRLAQLATTDPLTGLHNRRYLHETLSGECRRAARSGAGAAVVMLDVDHFKAVNDTHGHEFGDRVLVELAALLKAEARDTDTVARYGGEEFLIVMPETDADAAYRAAERLREKVAARSVNKGDLPVHVTISLGVATGDGLAPDTLIRYADEALYAAKAAGRNCTRVAARQEVGQGPHQRKSDAKA
jgi:diguanylate cyclase (GGDEF)-like protein/PAS domain S-box-containing protein